MLPSGSIMTCRAAAAPGKQSCGGRPAPSGNQRFAPVEEEWGSEDRIPMEEAQPADYVIGETGLFVDDRHAQDCFARYRSYNPEDNTYQPFGGGPRLQCE